MHPASANALEPPLMTWLCVMRLQDLGDVKALASMSDFMTPAESSLALKQSGYIAFPARFMEYLTAAGFTSSDFCLELSELAPDTSLFTSYQVEGETISIEPAGDQRRYVQLNESATVQELKEGNTLDRATLTKFEEVLHAVDKTGGDVWSFMPFLRTLYEITSPSLILNANPRKGHTLVDGSWHVDGPPGENFYVAVIPTDTLHLDVVPGSHHIVGRYAEAIPKTIAASWAYVEKLSKHTHRHLVKETNFCTRQLRLMLLKLMRHYRMRKRLRSRLHLVIQPQGSKPDLHADREPTAHPVECLVPCVSSHAFSSKILEPFRS
ncbi:hypothetical protein CEUSTIGMA_g7550.t1 [Chlamydomonas eustigma]|uniref:Uncharacterized protein n=1 Tax=Chlamydomonas eustigma TaxID=1157962 RepID=A0A250XB60_9CHLO|nr:hypothetical protein CEUSTIGMA_g7550.t1 [Chlamydomonas eustigma]|eukprot:GAX80112.1 hypothetical protein CEUSTIGMA_g7550.t1 [Chlamydomonas eustigma]